MCYNRSWGYGPHAGRGYGPWAHRGAWGGRHGRWSHSVPVNIEELDDRFELKLYAPSLVRENIKVTTKDDVLTISYKVEENASGNDRFTRREYGQDSFDRSFQLNGKVDVTKISAAYTEGVLTVLLPKDPEANKPAQDVPVR